MLWKMCHALTGVLVETLSSCKPKSSESHALTGVLVETEFGNPGPQHAESRPHGRAS